MRFTPQFLDELKSRLPVSEVVGRRVKLVRSGREFKGLSPFNKEKTASFFVNDQKEAWFDFSSQKNGSIFDFVMLTEGVSFPEAVEQLAQMAGMALPKVTPEDQQRDARRKTLHDVMEIAAKFFETTLASRAGAKARGYLADRGLDSPTQVKFRLGYSPGERYALKEHLGGQGISTADMVEAGLLIAGDDIPVPFDRFRDRVMFPITDARGRVIAFGGRALEKDVAAKYLNSPETPLFHKGHTLYNLASARQAAHDGAPVVVVEGYVDVIAMVTAGFPGAVAPLGTALTEDQLALIWKMADEPVLCFDGDGAGKRAAFRGVELAMPRLKPGKSLKFALLPQGQDPDDLLRSAGPDAVKDVINAAQPLAQMLWGFMTEGHDFGTPERRAALASRINEVTTGIADESVRKYYRQDFNDRLRQFFAPAQGSRPFTPRGQGSQQGNWRDRQGFAGAGPGRFGVKRPEVGSHNTPYVVVSQQMAASPVHRGHRTSVPTREALILQAALNYPWLLHDHLEELSELEFRHADAERVKGALIDIAAQDMTFGHESNMTSGHRSGNMTSGHVSQDPGQEGEGQSAGQEGGGRSVGHEAAGRSGAGQEGEGRSSGQEGEGRSSRQEGEGRSAGHEAQGRIAGHQSGGMSAGHKSQAPASGHEPSSLRAELAARGLSGAVERVEASITSPSVWGVRPDAAPEDVLVTWQQLVALHRQWHSLTKELKNAEQALGQDASEANYLRLRDVKDRLSQMDGTEALIEGFGASSGRGARTL